MFPIQFSLRTLRVCPAAALSLALWTGSAQAADIDDLYGPGAPGLLQAEPDDAAVLVGSDETEVIRERYPNRQVKIERHVVQDSAGNYKNHGPWSMWSPEGRLLGRGEYSNGERHGKWTRWFEAGEGEMFAGDIYNQFTPPFASQVEFKHGVLDGLWIVTDANGLQVSAWEFRSGRRHGNSVWWYPSGEKYRQVNYRNGEVHGEVMQWSADGVLEVNERYVNGRRYGKKVEYYSPGVIKYSAEYLFARPVVESTDDWWNGITRVKVTGKDGIDERHGMWTSWDENGQKILEGRYEHDVPVGKFTWWHANGQKAIEGQYADGNQEGLWVWWHANGNKQIEGYYTDGHQTDEWSWYDKSGKLTASTNYNNPKSTEDFNSDELPPELREIEAEIVDFYVQEKTVESNGISIGVTKGVPPTAVAPVQANFDPAPAPPGPIQALRNSALPFKLSAPTRK